jgi:preprotein translocase subunit SecG
MENVVLVIHLILALAIIGLVLIQRSEGGGLGIGGGGGGLGGFATPRGTANALTKMTAFFAACFFVTSLTLAIMAGAHHKSSGLLENFPEQISSEQKTGNQDVIEDKTAPKVEAAETSQEASESDTVKPAPKPSVPVGE